MESSKISFVVWEDPPTLSDRRRPITDQVIETLKTKPGKWARVRDYKSPSGAANHVVQFKKGKWKGLEGLEFKSARRGTGSSLYAKWVGNET